MIFNAKIEEVLLMTFAKDANLVTFRPNQSTTITNPRTVELPLGDDSHTLISRTSADQGSFRLLNKDLDASSVKFSDGTNQLDFDVSGMTDSRTVTIPDEDVTLVGLTNVQTISNKTAADFRVQSDDPAHDYIFNPGTLTASFSVALPVISQNDTFVFNDAAGILTNKTINATNNTISEIADGNIAANAGIAMDKLQELDDDLALITNGVGHITTSTVTALQLGTLAGATGNIQNQLNNKQQDVITSPGDLVVGNGSNEESRLPVGTDGQILSVVSGDVVWTDNLGGGSGDVEAANDMADNRLLRGDGGVKGIQDSGITLEDNAVLQDVGFVVGKKTIDFDMTIGSDRAALHPGYTLDTGSTLTVDTGGCLTQGISVINGTLVINGTVNALYT